MRTRTFVLFSVFLMAVGAGLLFEGSTLPHGSNAWALVLSQGIALVTALPAATAVLLTERYLGASRKS